MERDLLYLEGYNNNMGEIYKVNSIEEAVSLAKEYKNSGKYNLFRGQAQNWSVVPTMGRTNKEFDEIKDIIERLYYFMESHQPLHKYIDNKDWLVAIAQHYGIPTSFIDFTSNVEIAAFFATNSKSNVIGKDSVIICLNENDFNEFIRFIEIIFKEQKTPTPEVISIDVDNLWRLQSQEGYFLYTPVMDIEKLYNFDRIVFPYSKSYGKNLQDDIYPKRKSELEILLDQFFNSEKRLEGYKRMLEFSKEIKIPIERFPSINFDSIVKPNSIHKSWKSTIYKKWLYSFNERWDSTRKIHYLKISVNNELLFTEIERYTIIYDKLCDFFENSDVTSKDEIKFSLIVAPKLNNKLSKIMNRSCSRIWDGMRNLPYSLKEIIYVLSKYIYFEIFDNKKDISPLDDSELLVLELTNEYRSVTRCYASEHLIIEAFREDINDIFTYPVLNSLSSKILLEINDPRIIFDFQKLLSLFKAEIIIYQVLYNSENEKPVIFFTPTQITILGYA
ncbi:FRG domain-containing protein [Flavobacterium salilacus subsp. salilacus]|uniref:FRG domain-containing protein n=1 Tax=Flavobacterium TaxID=237 RepID=UPI00107552F4|nr:MULTISPECIES: FRG domain-containing protein [Flavobacterium]KAF2518663.1 FRG domain-containing protein [Flavobacterium salilacus subsp. salilacus]MBE1613625.1 FRG domain-containing protein [Flavobacterium sp. SaA2.13]